MSEVLQSCMFFEPDELGESLAIAASTAQSVPYPRRLNDKLDSFAIDDPDGNTSTVLRWQADHWPGNDEYYAIVDEQDVIRGAAIKRIDAGQLRVASGLWIGRLNPSFSRYDAVYPHPGPYVGAWANETYLVEAAYESLAVRCTRSRSADADYENAPAAYTLEPMAAPRSVHGALVRSGFTAVKHGKFLGSILNGPTEWSTLYLLGNYRSKRPDELEQLLTTGFLETVPSYWQRKWENTLLYLGHDV